MLGVQNSQLSPRPVNMPLSEEIESNDKVTRHLEGKNNSRPPDRYRPASARFTFCKPPCNLSCATTKPGDASRHCPGTAFGGGFPAGLVSSRHTLETLLESRRQGQHLQSHWTLPGRRVPQLSAAHTRRRGCQVLHT